MDIPVILSMVSIDQNANLMIPMLVEEIEKVIKSMKLDKALGPGNYLMFFFQHFWY